MSAGSIPRAERAAPKQPYKDKHVKKHILDRIYYQVGNLTLDLSECAIVHVPLGVIQHYFGEVTSLNLSSNEIRQLPSKFVSQLESLTRLDLSKNRLDTLPDNFGRLDQLVYLDIKQNNLQRLPLSMGKMRQLNYLNVDQNPFQLPVCELLMYKDGSSTGRLTGSDMAQLVVKFLLNLANETVPAGDYASICRKSVSFVKDDDVNASGTNSVFSELVQESIPKKKKSVSSVSSAKHDIYCFIKQLGLNFGMLLVITLVFLTPFLFFESSYFNSAAKEDPIHETLIKIMPINRAYVLRGLVPEKGERRMWGWYNTLTLNNQGWILMPHLRRMAIKSLANLLKRN